METSWLTCPHPNILGEEIIVNTRFPARATFEFPFVEVIVGSLGKEAVGTKKGEVERQDIFETSTGMSKDPWLDVETLYQVNQQAKGKITKLQSYGAFLELSSGIQGLLHKKEMSLDGTKEPSEIVSEGQEIDVIITSIEKADRKMSFSIKPFLN